MVSDSVEPLIPQVPRCIGVTAAERPLCDSRYGSLRAGKLPFIRDGARFALRLAGLGLSRLGEGRPLPNTRVDVHKTCLHVFPYVLELM